MKSALSKYLNLKVKDETKQVNLILKPKVAVVIKTPILGRNKKKPNNLTQRTMSIASSGAKSTKSQYSIAEYGRDIDATHKPTINKKSASMSKDNLPIFSEDRYRMEQAKR